MIYLIEYWELGFEPSAYCFLDLLISSRFLPSKLVAWKCQNLKICHKVMTLKLIGHQMNYNSVGSSVATAIMTAAKAMYNYGSLWYNFSQQYYALAKP